VLLDRILQSIALRGAHEVLAASINKPIYYNNKPPEFIGGDV